MKLSNGRYTGIMTLTEAQWVLLHLALKTVMDMSPNFCSRIFCEINETLERLNDADWQRMKEHMDKKFPNMKLPDMESFKELVRLYGLATEHYEKKLN